MLALAQEKVKGKNKLEPRLLGITKESVVRVDNKTKEVRDSIHVRASNHPLCKVCYGDVMRLAAEALYLIVRLTVFCCHWMITLHSLVG